MECFRLRCQLCFVNFNTVRLFRKHMHCHEEKLKEIYPNDPYLSKDCIPYIVFMDGKRMEATPSVFGLSHLTLVFGGNKPVSFYLCHVCHFKCPPHSVLEHMFSDDHLTNYLSLTDPNSLLFSWTPNKGSNASRQCLENVKRQHEIQLLHLPARLFTNFQSSVYSTVMSTLRENENIFKHLQAALPNTDSVRTYQNDCKRENPMLGLQHIVECVCEDLDNERHYLCTLCQLTVPPYMIIKHILSFDHVFHYFEAWHPSTLFSKASHHDDTSLTYMLLGLAKQAEELQEWNNMKHVSLKPDEFKSVNFKSYSNALEKLESIQNCSLQITAKPGRKLVPCVPSVFSSVFKMECQACKRKVSSMRWFIKHLFNHFHKEATVNFFSCDADAIGQTVSYNLGLYSYILKCLSSNQPVVGVPMILSCITTEAKDEPVYLCSACEECFTNACVEQHLTSQTHLRLTASQYQDLEVLPFAWESTDVDEASLKTKVWKKERAGGFIHMKVFDVPHWTLGQIAERSYSEVMDVLQNYSSYQRPAVVKTNKLKNNFPRLGEQFLVMYDTAHKRAAPYKTFLCLLCERKLHDDESSIHIFSLEHVTNFLEKFHPGSLTCRNVNSKCLLDLAKQAQPLHSAQRFQVINLIRPAKDVAIYRQILHVLRTAKKRDTRELVDPPITPKGRLFDSESPFAVAAKLRVEQTQSVENKGAAENPREQKVAVKEETSETVSAEENKADEPPLKTSKQEPQESEVTNTGEVVSESSPSSGQDFGVHCKKEEAENAEAQVKTSSDEGRGSKRAIGECEGSQEDATPGEHVGHKRQCTMSEGDGGLKKQKTDAVETSRTPQRDEGSRKIFDCRYDKRDSVYLCECCSLKIPQKEFLGHVLGSGHPHVHQEVVNLDEEAYNVVSKQSFESAMQAVSSFLIQRERGPERISASASHPVKTEPTESDIWAQRSSNSVMDHVKEGDLKAEGSEVFGAASSTPDVTSKTTQIPEQVKVETKPHVNISQAETNLLPHNAEEDSKPNPVPLGTEAALKGDEETSSPCTAAARQATEVTRASGPTASQTASVCPPLPCKTGSDTKSALKIPEPAPPKDPAVHETTTAVVENNPKHLNVAPATSGTCHLSTKSVVTAKKPAPEAQKRNSAEERVKISSHMKENTRSVPPRATIAAAVRPKCKNKSAETQLPAAQRTASVDRAAKIGSDQLIVLTCSKNRQQVYCQLCSVKLQSSDHLREISHQYNYVKMKIPGWTSRPFEDPRKFQEAVSMLAKQQGNSCQSLQVTIEEYDKVNRLPVKAALPRLKEMLRQRSSKGSSSSTANNVAALHQNVVSGSPCEVTSSDDGVNVGNNHNPAKPQVGDPESAFPKTPATGKETAVSSQQRPVKNPESLKTPEDAGKTSGVACSDPDQVEPAADDDDDDKEVQNPPGSQIHQAGKHVTKPGANVSSEEPQTVYVGEKIRGPSNLSRYLLIKYGEAQPIVGKGTIWECQGTSESPLFMCESCELMLQIGEICPHMISKEHKFKYVKKYHSELLHFWTAQDLSEEQKAELFNVVCHSLWTREKIKEVDATVVFLNKGLYELLQNIQCSYALKILHRISEGKLITYWPDDSPTPGQQLESLQGLLESRPTEMQSGPTPDKDHRRESEAQEKPVEEAAVDRELNDVQTRKASRTLDKRSLPSKSDSVAAPFPQAGRCNHPKETCTSLCASPVSQHQMETVPMASTNQMEDSNSPTTTPIDREAAKTLPVPDPPSRKRPADTPVGVLVRSCTGNSSENSTAPLLQEPSSVPASESAAAPRSALPLQLDKRKSSSEQKTVPPSYLTALSQLINTLRAEKTKELLFALLASNQVKPVSNTSVPADEGKTSLTECRGSRTGDGDSRVHDPSLIKTESGAAAAFMTAAAESSNPQHPQGSRSQLRCTDVASSGAVPESLAACPISTVVIGRGNYASSSEGPVPNEANGDSQAGTPAGSTRPPPPPYSQCSKVIFEKNDHLVYSPAVNPTFTTPVNMAVNPTVNPSLNPPASSAVHPNMTSVVNLSLQRQADSFNPPDDGVHNHLANPHLNAFGNPADCSMVAAPISSQAIYNSAVGLYPQHSPALTREPMWRNMQMQQYYQQHYYYYHQQYYQQYYRQQYFNQQ